MTVTVSEPWCGSVIVTVHVPGTIEPAGVTVNVAELPLSACEAGETLALAQLPIVALITPPGKLSSVAVNCSAPPDPRTEIVSVFGLAVSPE